MTPDAAPDLDGPEPEGPDVVGRSRPLPKLRWVAVWAVLGALAVALDGAVGAAVAVAVAAVVLARLPREVIGGAGVACLVGAPIVFVVQGVPSPSEVSPFVIVGRLWPHHLAFAGFALAGVWVIWDLVPRLRPEDGPSAASPASSVVSGHVAPEPYGRLGVPARVAVVVAAAATALAVIAAVWTT